MCWSDLCAGSPALITGAELCCAGFQTAATGRAMRVRRAALLEQLAVSEASSEQSEVLSVAIQALVALKQDRSSATSTSDGTPQPRSRSM